MLRTWSRIAVNKAIDVVRANGRRPSTSLEAAEDQAAPPSEAAELNPLIVAALETLDVVDRAMVVARYVLDYRATEIAAWFEIPDATVRSRLHRATKRLKAYMEESS